MKEADKKRLERAFDTGELDSVLSGDGSGDEEIIEFSAVLAEIESVLKAGTAVEVPGGFAERVSRRLPASRKVKQPSMLFYLFKPALYVSAVILSILFSDLLGISALVKAVEPLFSAGSETATLLVYVIVTSVCMLATLALMVGSMNGIRSRRVER